jgi:hypothetical protein
MSEAGLDGKHGSRRPVAMDRCSRSVARRECKLPRNCAMSQVPFVHGWSLWEEYLLHTHREVSHHSPPWAPSQICIISTIYPLKCGMNSRAPGDVVPDVTAVSDLHAADPHAV